MVASFSTESPAQRRAQANTVPGRSTCSNSTVKTFAACEPYPSCCAVLIRLRSDRALRREHPQSRVRVGLRDIVSKRLTAGIILIFVLP